MTARDLGYTYQPESYGVYCNGTTWDMICLDQTNQMINIATDTLLDASLTNIDSFIVAGPLIIYRRGTEWTAGAIMVTRLTCLWPI